MDPNENLAEQLRLSAKFIEALENGRIVSELDTRRLAELVEALNEWLARGGPLPLAWGERKTEERICGQLIMQYPRYPAPDGLPVTLKCTKPRDHAGKCSFKRGKAHAP